ASPDASIVVATGYGNNPNSQSGHGYGKLTLADGRHWDFDAGRKVIDDRGDLYAGPLRWTCVEPLQHWRLELGENASGVSWQIDYRSRFPLWELRPIEIRRDGRTIVSMQHIQQGGLYDGWVDVEGEGIALDG